MCPPVDRVRSPFDGICPGVACERLIPRNSSGRSPCSKLLPNRRTAEGFAADVRRDGAVCDRELHRPGEDRRVEAGAPPALGFTEFMEGRNRQWLKEMSPNLPKSARFPCLSKNEKRVVFGFIADLGAGFRGMRL